MIKQVIIIRTDLNMRKGKMIAQGAHASLTAVMYDQDKDNGCGYEWIRQGQTKIVVGIDSEEGLKLLYEQAKNAGLTCSYIVDAGKTEFKQPTPTAVCIGPNLNTEIDKITRNLKLL